MEDTASEPVSETTPAEREGAGETRESNEKGVSTGHVLVGVHHVEHVRTHVIQLFLVPLRVAW
jgi:hypothetical protein